MTFTVNNLRGFNDFHLETCAGFDCALERANPAPPAASRPAATPWAATPPPEVPQIPACLLENSLSTPLRQI